MRHTKPKITKPDGEQRSGRGFSPDEIKKAGLTRAEARKMALPVDNRRKTAHEENVEAIKEYTRKAKAVIKTKPKPAPKPVAKDKKEKPKE
jgi:ribosomal protein L13E